ncbi:hypothetical protein CONPUDRAFT_164665 [Coniophora puteana RWD-64-598 SS2]|uniref:Uncharacterized protein n=1 Tax=Coniophora puteana (strain RWD-64-598) TaxID=741705 RepID=A0A5M3MS31_CONPW|nr:uncharacterized protein CONPUDRAFT_164665 [Coniophora puteana RWD-64-598 SS2]EIW81958.1 hypothetical protein CONPUDRAFT_164665 [Coniophora puteana RWD-64-598 SS2]
MFSPHFNQSRLGLPILSASLSPTTTTSNANTDTPISMEGQYTLLLVLLVIFATTTVILIAYLAYKAYAKLKKVVDEEARHGMPKASSTVPRTARKERSSRSSWSTWFQWNRSYDSLEEHFEKPPAASYTSPHELIPSAPLASSPIHDVPSRLHRWILPSPLPRTPNKRPGYRSSPARRLLGPNASDDSFSEINLHPNGTPVAYLSMPPALRARSPSPAFMSPTSPTSPERMAQMQRDPKLSPVQGPVRPMVYFKSL